MPRPLTGHSRVRSGNVYLRVRGHEWTIGPRSEWTDAQIEAELEKVIAQIKAGVWRGPTSRVAAPEQSNGVPTISQLAKDYLAAKQRKGMDVNTEADLLWKLNDHLLPYFGDPEADRDFKANEITVKLIEDYQAHKIREREYIQSLRARHKAGEELSPAELEIATSNMRGLGNSSIMRTVELLAALLRRAMRDHPDDMPTVNPAEHEDLKLRLPPKDRTSFEVDQVLAILEAAGERDRTARREDERRIGRKAMMATLLLTGMRIDELCNLRRDNLRLELNRLDIADAKTVAGIRQVYVCPTLKEILEDYLKQAVHSEYVFPSTRGGKRDDNRFRDRIQANCVKDANELLAERGKRLIPEKAATHTHACRRSYITMALDNGETPHWLMGQVGHTSSRLIMEIYAQHQQSRARAHPELRELLGPPGRHWEAAE